jgi:hypothetical protein
MKSAELLEALKIKPFLQRFRTSDSRAASGEVYEKSF